MALPKLLQKLFTNGGAGDKLNQDIIPDIPYSKVTDAPSVDSALSSTSENPVQNKVINSALDGKLSTSGGTMTGDIIFSSNATKIENAQNKGGKVEVSSTGASLLSNKDDYEGGAALLLRSSTYPNDQKGYFYLISALSTSQRHNLVGKPDGSLTWGGRNVLTGNSAGLTVVAESYRWDSWYRKYSDGWIEQGLVFTYTGSKNWATPFISSPYTVLASSAINPTVSSTSITVSDMNYGSSAKPSQVYVYACGK